MRGRPCAMTRRGNGGIAGRFRTAIDPPRFQCLPRGDIRVSKAQEKCCDQLKLWNLRGFGSYPEGTSEWRRLVRECAQSSRKAYAARCAGLKQKPSFPRNLLMADASCDAGEAHTSPRGLPW